MLRPVLLLASVLALGGCYHATVETGRAPSGQTVENAWAHSFIGGLVPPSTVNTASECPDGVARVRTQLHAGRCPHLRHLFADDHRRRLRDGRISGDLAGGQLESDPESGFDRGTRT